MEHKSPLREKSYAFALRVTLFCKQLMEEKREFVLSKQLLRSGTSIGASIEEAQQAESRRDFISKLSIALKEGCESRYWICLVRDAGYASEQEAEKLLRALGEIIALLSSSIKTAKRNLSK